MWWVEAIIEGVSIGAAIVIVVGIILYVRERNKGKLKMLPIPHSNYVTPESEKEHFQQFRDCMKPCFRGDASYVTVGEIPMLGDDFWKCVADCVNAKRFAKPNPLQKRSP